MAQNELYLASKSPRRLELLQQIGVMCSVVHLRDGATRPRDVDETPRPGESPFTYVERMAKIKCEIGWLRIGQRRLHNKPLLTADTIVVHNGRIIGKPATAMDAMSTLRLLSGGVHDVISAVAVTNGIQTYHDVSSTRVRFRDINDMEISSYVATGEPMDKAGSYGIQGKAAMWVERIEGSYTGVVGLPLFETAELLRRVGIDLT
jgi:septum formation protein